MSLAREVTARFRVRYAETDGQRVAYHAHYLTWFEVARGEYLRALGFDYNQMEDGGALIVVAEAHARYLAPARYDDVVAVTARLAEVRHRSFRFEYRVSRDDTPLAEGWTSHVVVNASGKPIAIPPGLLAAINGPAGDSYRGDALDPTLA